MTYFEARTSICTKVSTWVLCEVFFTKYFEALQEPQIRYFEVKYFKVLTGRYKITLKLLGAGTGMTTTAVVVSTAVLQSTWYNFEVFFCFKKYWQMYDRYALEH